MPRVTDPRSPWRTVAPWPHYPLIFGRERQADAAYLDACRTKRNAVEYDYAGAATDADAAELLAFAVALRADVVAWLRQHAAHLLEP